MAAIAAPIKDSEGRLLTTLSIHAPVQRYDLGSLIKMLPQLQKAAARIESLNKD